MSETEPEDAAAPAPAVEPVRVRRPLVLLPAMISLVLVAMLAAQVWLWYRQEDLASSIAALPTPAPAAAPADIAALRTELGRLRQQVATLRQALAAPAPDITSLHGQLDKVQQEIAALRQAPAAPAPDTAGLRAELDKLQQQVAALRETRPASGTVDLRPLEARIAALEQRPAPPDIGPVLAKLDQVAAEAAAARSAEAATAERLAALQRQLASTQLQAGQLAGVAAQARRLEQAQVALQSGQPLGDIPGAPPALARFAHAKPPTEASLRLAFPAAAQAAVRASRGAAEDGSFGARVWLRMRSLVTVKQGDKVLVGVPAAEVLGQAQARLDAGDLAGAVTTLDGLDPAAAAAMADWRGQAQALLEARAALARMARG